MSSFEVTEERAMCVMSETESGEREGKEVLFSRALL